MKEQIQQLIAAGQTKDALNLLVQTNPDALLLQAQYNNGEKQFNLGLIEFAEWGRIQARVNFAALEMAGKPAVVPAGGHGSHAGGAASPAPATGGASGTPADGSAKKVFISYNHQDKEMADQVKAFLENGGLDVTIDREKMEPGESISDFIKNNIKSNGYIVSIVSENSLQSGWVGMESTASLFAEWIADKHFIPVALDNSFGDNEFYIKALTNINAAIKKKNDEKKQAERLGGRTQHIQGQIERLLDLKANLGQILEKLQGVLTLNISGDDFKPNMTEVLDRIKKR